MIKTPSGEQLKKVQSKDVQHCLQHDGYNCGVYVIKVSAQTMNGMLCNIFCFICSKVKPKGYEQAIQLLNIFFNSSHQKSLNNCQSRQPVSTFPISNAHCK